MVVFKVLVMGHLARNSRHVKSTSLVVSTIGTITQSHRMLPASNTSEVLASLAKSVPLAVLILRLLTAACNTDEVGVEISTWQATSKLK